MLGAFYKSDQFINCAAQIINSYNAQQFINGARVLGAQLSTMEQAKGEHKKLFQEFCEKAFLENDGSKKCTSKTISEEKAVRIKEVLKGKKLEVYTPSFRFWVNKTNYSIFQSWD